MGPLHIARLVTSFSALCVAACLAVAPVSAFEIFGLKFFEDQSEEDAAAVIADPQPYTVAITINATGAVESAVRNASALVADQNERASGAAGVLATSRADYRPLVAALYNEGYYGGTASIRVGGVEAANLAPDVNLPDPVDIAIVVAPGPQFRFNSVNIVNQALPT